MLRDELKAIVGAAGCIDDPADMVPFLTEWRGLYKGIAQLVVLPASTEEVAGVVTVCARHSVAIVPQGGNTGLCGGAIPDASGKQVVLSLKRMNRIRVVDADDFSIVVDAGCTLAQVQQAATDVGRFFPLSLSAEGSCQIGGNISTNAGGINVLRYGTARQQVLGLEVVLADGKVIEGLRALRKDTAGYDIKQLFMGAEGTLGVITGACLRLQPDPGEISTALAAVQTPGDSVRLLSLLRDRLGDVIQAFELIPDRAIRYVTRHIPGTRATFDSDAPWCVLIAAAATEKVILDVFESALNDRIATNVVIAKNLAEAESMWRIRHSISEAQKFEGASLKHDVSVPVAKIGEFIERAEAAIARQLPRARVVAFGHVGDGNVHFNVSQPKGEEPAKFLDSVDDVAHTVYGIVAEFNGSFSAEHGIGQGRRRFLSRYRSNAEIATMKAVKAALDPQGIMNPGKVL